MVNKPPKSLIEHLIAERCVLFVGSGLSAWAKLPTWKDFLEFMIEKLYEEDQEKYDKGELDNLLEKGKLLEIADYCKAELSSGLYNKILSTKLRGDNVDIPEPHKLIVQMPFSAIVTTNYDKLRAFPNLTG